MVRASSVNIPSLVEISLHMAMREHNERVFVFLFCSFVGHAGRSLFSVAELLRCLAL